MSPEGISIVDNNKNSAIMLAISTIMLYDKKEAAFTEFIAKFSTDFADNGMIDTQSIKDEIAKGEKNAHPDEVSRRMKEFYGNKGVTIECDDFSKYIDFNGDGVIDENDNEEPTYELVEESYFNTKEEVISALGYAYSQVSLFETYQLSLEAIRLGKVDGDQYGIVLKSVNDNTIYQAWGTAYRAIAMLNQMITMMQNNNANFDIKPYIAEATALRSWVYYQLALLWGNVPIPTGAEGIMDPIPQKNQQEAWMYALSTLQSVINDFASVYSSDEIIYHFDKTKAYVLMTEINLALGNRSEAKRIIDGVSNYNLSFNVSSTIRDDFPYIYTNIIRKGDWQPIYTENYINLLKKEANGNVDGLSIDYMSLENDYGVWAALKRLGKAQETCECEDYELLLPIPQSEIVANMYITQNPGY